MREYRFYGKVQFQLDSFEKWLSRGSKIFSANKTTVWIMISYEPLTFLLEMRKAFDSLLASHFSAVMQ
jgi:hypothetical protein